MIDAIFLKHDVEFQHLSTAVQKHKIDKDEDIVELQTAVRKIQQEAAMAESKKSDLSMETMQRMNTEIAQLPDAPERGQPKVLKFAYCLSLF